VNQKQQRFSEEDLAAFEDMADLVRAMHMAVKHQAKQTPSASGLYPATVFITADGQIMADKDGMPVVICPPFNVERVEDRTVYLSHPDQHLSPGNLAKLADVSVDTVWRAVKTGDLPKPTQLSSRRVGIPLQGAQSWLAGRKKA
jgi:predicted DNA-binding transcriptional regulator AlpA